MDNAELIELAKTGDSDAVAALYMETYRTTRFLSQQMIGDNETAVALLKKCYNEVFTNLDSISSPDRFAQLVYRTLLNKVAESLMSQGDLQFYESQGDRLDANTDISAFLKDYEPKTELNLYTSIRNSMGILRLLSLEQRISVLMCVFAQMNAAEIAEDLFTKEQTITSRLRYAKDKITIVVEDLKEQGDEMYGLDIIPYFVCIVKFSAKTKEASKVPAKSDMMAPVEMAKMAVNSAGSKDSEQVNNSTRVFSAQDMDTIQSAKIPETITEEMTKDMEIGSGSPIPDEETEQKAPSQSARDSSKPEIDKDISQQYQPISGKEAHEAELEKKDDIASAEISEEKQGEIQKSESTDAEDLSKTQTIDLKPAAPYINSAETAGIVPESEITEDLGKTQAIDIPPTADESKKRKRNRSRKKKKKEAAAAAANAIPQDNHLQIEGDAAETAVGTSSNEDSRNMGDSGEDQTRIAEDLGTTREIQLDTVTGKISGEVVEKVQEKTEEASYKSEGPALGTEDSKAENIKDDSELSRPHNWVATSGQNTDYRDSLELPSAGNADIDMNRDMGSTQVFTAAAQQPEPSGSVGQNKDGTQAYAVGGKEAEAAATLPALTEKLKTGVRKIPQKTLKIAAGSIAALLLVVALSLLWRNQTQAKVGSQIPAPIIVTPHDKNPEADAESYLLPKSSESVLNRADVEGMSDQDLQLARDEILARHGVVFEDGDSQAHFDSMDWYEKTVAIDEFDYSRLSAAELTNLSLLKSFLIKDITQDGYILPESSNWSLNDIDLAGLTNYELSLARNEIYARHGRIFEDSEIQSFFEEKSWYEGSVAGSDFDEAVLSELEQSNVEFIKSREEREESEVTAAAILGTAEKPLTTYHNESYNYDLSIPSYWQDKLLIVEDAQGSAWFYHADTNLKTDGQDGLLLYMTTYDREDYSYDSIMRWWYLNNYQSDGQDKKLVVLAPSAYSSGDGVSEELVQMEDDFRALRDSLIVN